jgi:hypothetical protein
MAEVAFGVLGPVEVSLDGEPLAIGAALRKLLTEADGAEILTPSCVRTLT